MKIIKCCKEFNSSLKDLIAILEEGGYKAESRPTYRLKTEEYLYLKGFFNGLESIEKEIITDEKRKEILVRIGQGRFALAVKRNYKYECCFPDCGVNNKRFLIGAHIDRWADNKETRGDVSNGLCLCLMHDKAFEIGNFTLNDSYQVEIIEKSFLMDSWALKNLNPWNGQYIKLGEIKPSIDSLNKHRLRVKELISTSEKE